MQQFSHLRISRGRGTRLLHQYTNFTLCKIYHRMYKLIQEDILGFAEGKTTTGKRYQIYFLLNEKYGIIIANMRAQGYDDAVNMSGVHRCVQARVRERIPLASYVHCKTHNLDLAIWHMLVRKHSFEILWTSCRRSRSFLSIQRRV